MTIIDIIPKNKNSEEEVGQLERRRMLSRGQEKSLIDSSENTNGHNAEEHGGSHVGSVSLDNVQGNEPVHGDAASDTAFTKFLADDVSEFQEKDSDNQKDSKENAGHQSEGNSSNVKHKDVIKELDPEIVKEYDVEEVLAKQETHDLYCPKCQTCITKRVILKKRKRTTSDSSSEPQRPRFDTEGESDATSPDAAKPDREPEAFQCLYCLRIFIPIERGFKLFRCFGDGGEEENMPSSVEQPQGKTAWWLSCFGENNEPSETRLDQSKTDGQEQPISESENIPPSDDGTLVEYLGHEQKNVTKPVGVKGEKPVDPMSSNSARSYGVGKYTKPPASTGHLKPMKPGVLDPAPSGVGTEAKPSGTIGPKLTPMKSRDFEQLETGTRPATNQTQQGEAEEGFGVEILKSIVYGGLVECVTSLGVVSSAAGSGASTLNILALGFANLFSGLTVIAHSLQELKKDDQQVRYKELLGRRENFRLHAFISFLSFLAFGLIPPLVYAFSFRESDDKNYKAISVFAASFFCIVLLAVAKVWVRRESESYVKTVLYYASIVISSSGISFFIGNLVGEFLRNLGWFETNRTVMFSVVQGKPVEPGLVSF